MLVCSVSLKAPRAAIAADIAEAADALDVPGTGNVVFATLVDDPASVNENVDAYLGEIMVEAVTTTEAWDASIPQVYAADVAEAATAADNPSWVAAAFTPADLTGLIGWWDASITASLGLSGSQVLSMADQSGGGRTMNWANDKPTYSATGFNSKPGISVILGSALQANSFPMGTGNTLTAWIVSTIGSTGSQADGRLLSYATGGSDTNNAGAWAFDRASSTLARFTRNSVSATKTTTTHPAPHRFIITIDSSGVMTLYIDGVASTTATSSGNWVSSRTMSIGRRAAVSSEFWVGDFAEAGVATGYHDATVVAQLDTYLKTKWGL